MAYKACLNILVPTNQASHLHRTSFEHAEHTHIQTKPLHTEKRERERRHHRSLTFTLCSTAHVVSFFRHMSHNMWPLFFLVSLFFSPHSLLVFVPRNSFVPFIHSFSAFLLPSIIHYPNTKRLKLIKTLTFCRRSTFTIFITAVIKWMDGNFNSCAWCFCVCLSNAGDHWSD